MLPEIDLTATASLPEGALKTFATPADGPQVLLTRQQGQVHAFAPNCPHYGAPLEKGKVVNGKLICPWHHACFRLDSGHLCEPPALDDLPTYAVREADGRILVQVPPSPPASTDQPAATPTAELGGTPPPAPAEAPADARTFVIVGGGAAGEYAAQTLRREGFLGRVVLVSAEAKIPYDRTKLSKAYLAGKARPAAMPLRETGFYAAQNIEWLPATRVVGLDLAKQTIDLEGQLPLPYDQLLLAPGGTPNLLPKLPGHHLAGVLPLRTQADADALLQATKDAKEVVIIGASFIGMEAASSLIGEGRAVTVIASEKVPFQRVLGPEIGAMFQKLHEEKGVKFEIEAEATALLGDGHVSSVQLKTGQTLPADVVVLGVGVRPATDFLKDAFTLEKDGGLAVNELLQASPHVYAAGDVARFPLAATGQPARIEHWRLAQQHGRTAARNMLGRQEKFAAAPFFWTQQYGKSLRYAGHAEQWDEIVYHGEVEKQDFLAFYVQAGRIAAVAGMGRDPDMIYIAELLGAGQMPAPAALHEGMQWGSQAA